jgi:hypothetical protein
MFIIVIDVIGVFCRQHDEGISKKKEKKDEFEGLLCPTITRVFIIISAKLHQYH